MLSGYDTYVYVAKEKRSMLNTKAKKGIYIGYKDRAKCYKSMESIIKKTIYSRDVIFKEVKSTPKHDNKPREREKKLSLC